MGWSNSTFQLLIVTSSPAGFSGLFVYSPAPGPGNLIASIASTTGTDPYGNSYQAGITSYSGSTAFAQMTAGTLKFRDSVGANYLFEAVQETGAPTFLFQVPGVGGPFNLFINTTANIVGSIGAAGGPETWHTMTITAVGFAAGTPAPRYRFEPMGSAGVVRFSGVISLTANQAANAVFFTMPTAYRPTVSQFFICANQLSGAAAQNTSLEVDPNGNVSIQVAGTNGNTLALDGVTYVLD